MRLNFARITKLTPKVIPLANQETLVTTIGFCLLAMDAKSDAVELFRDAAKDLGLP